MKRWEYNRDRRRLAREARGGHMDTGFYWIVYAGEWTVGEFDGRLWWVPGMDLPVTPEQIGDRIERPLHA